MKTILFKIFFLISVTAYGQSYLYDIDREFKNWLVKGEYEKTVDYQNRITNNAANVYDSICYKICNKYIDREIYNISKGNNIYFNLRGYNADAEKFGLSISYIGENAIIDSISIQIKDAPIFKTKFVCGSPENNENWKIYKEYHFIPTEITYYYGYNNQVLNKTIDINKFISNNEAEAIEVNYKDVSRNFNFHFDYNKYFNENIFIVKDAEAINSLAWSCLLKQDFTRALQVLERGITIIDKSNRTYPYLLSNLAHAYLFNNQFEKAQTLYFSNSTLKLDDISWKDAVLTDFKEFNNLGITSPDMDKIKEELLKRKK
jgi:hypothetical protein